MTIIRNKTTIDLTEEERKAIKIVSTIARDLYYGLDNNEMDRFNDLMKESIIDDIIEVNILNFSCLINDFQKNIDEFNSIIN
jgi:hypothetical protein